MASGAATPRCSKTRVETPAWEEQKPSRSKALATSLAKHKSLGSLSLADNAVGDAGGVALSRMLERNRTLRTLSLANNALAERGCAALRAALKANGGALRSFDMRTWLSRPHQCERRTW